MNEKKKNQKPIYIEMAKTTIKSKNEAIAFDIRRKKVHLIRFAFMAIKYYE